MTKKLLLTSAIAALFTISGVAGVQANKAHKGKMHHEHAGKCFKDMDKKEEMKAKNQADCEKQKGTWVAEEKKEEMKDEMKKEEKKDN